MKGPRLGCVVVMATYVQADGTWDRLSSQWIACRSTLRLTYRLTYKRAPLSRRRACCARAPEIRIREYRIWRAGRWCRRRARRLKRRPLPTPCRLISTDGPRCVWRSERTAKASPPPLPLTSDVLPADGCPKCERERWVALPDGGRYCGGCGHGFPVPPVSAARRERERLRDEREQAEAEERRRKARRYRLRSALNPEGHVVEDVETVNPGLMVSEVCPHCGGATQDDCMKHACSGRGSGEYRPSADWNKGGDP